MNESVIWRLILKDVRLHRFQIILSSAVGAGALALFQTKREVPLVLGATWFSVALIVLGCMMPISNVVNERKNHHVAFLMSLPISARQYAMTKIASTFGMFFVPWALLAGGALLVIGAGFPHGAIPISTIITGLILTGFCVVAGTAVVSESEAWTTVAIVLCNSSYGIAWYLIIRVPETARQVGGSVAVWSPRLLTILGAECAVVILCLGLTLYLQSRKRDFI